MIAAKVALYMSILARTVNAGSFPSKQIPHPSNQTPQEAEARAAAEEHNQRIRGVGHILP